MRGRKGHGIEIAPRAGGGPPGVALVVELLGLVGPCYRGGPQHCSVLTTSPKVFIEDYCQGTPWAQKTPGVPSVGCRLGPEAQALRGSAGAE